MYADKKVGEVFYAGKTHNRPFRGSKRVKAQNNKLLELALHWYFYVPLRPHALSFII
jgi:hypothetical protein